MTGAKRRFYIAEYNGSRRPVDDYKFLNLQEIKAHPRGLPRTTKVMTPYSDIPVSCGLPQLKGKPKVAVWLKAKRQLDAYKPGAYRMISPRAKALIDEIDPDAFEMVECDTQTRKREPFESYWLAAIKRVVIEFDVENSVLERARQSEDPQARYNPNFRYIFELCIPDLPEDVHAFILSRYGLGKWIWDDVLVDAWRDNGLSGLEFTPLQEPSDEEFAGFEWWSNQMNRLYWARKRGLIE